MAETEQEITEREKKIVRNIEAKLGEKFLEEKIMPRRIKIMVKPNLIKEAATYIKNELGFDHVVLVSGTDYPNDNVMEVVYHIATYGRKELRDLVISLVSRVPRDDPKISTLTSIWPSSEYAERETHEMLGIVFEGHPKLERLLLPEDWNDIPPLRKDFKPPER